MYRSWLALCASGLLGGLAVAAGFAGFESPLFFAVAAGCALGAVLAYRYAAERMLDAVYENVGRRPPPPRERAGTTDREAASRATDGGEAAGGRTDSGGYDDWTWADVEADDPFWSADAGDWEDPWAWERVDPDEAGRGWSWEDWREREHRSERGRWWEEMGEDDDGDETVESRLESAYETLGLEPGAGPEAVRDAYRERAKETHPDTEGGSVEAFLRVREAYEHLRERGGSEG